MGSFKVTLLFGTKTEVAVLTDRTTIGQLRQQYGKKLGVPKGANVLLNSKAGNDNIALSKDATVEFVSQTSSKPFHK